MTWQWQENPIQSDYLISDKNVPVKIESIYKRNDLHQNLTAL